MYEYDVCIWCMNNMIHKYDIYGNYDIADHNTIVVNELPIGQWTTPYKEFLETIEYESNNAWVGCSWEPSPALTIGTFIFSFRWWCQATSYPIL